MICLYSCRHFVFRYMLAFLLCVLFKCLLLMLLHHWDVLSASDCLCGGLLRGICTASAFICSDCKLSLLIACVGSVSQLLLLASCC